MRILVVHNTLTDSTSISGVFKHYACMANEWHAMGHEVDFLMARAGEKQLRNLAPHAGLVCSDGLFDATRYIEKTWRYLPAYAYRLLTAFWVRLPHKYDVVVASWPFALEVLNTLVIAWRQKAGWIIKYHHVHSAQKNRNSLFDAMHLYSERLSTRLANRYAGGIICSTEVVANDVRALTRSLGLPERPLRVIGYGIDPSQFTDKSSEKKYDLLFLGRIHEQKGVDDLPHLWERIVAKKPNARLLIIGEGSRRREMTAQFVAKKLIDTVTITGGVSEAEKNALIPQARLGISLSYEEGWGLSITEFLSAGLPVIAYHLPVFDSVFPGHLDLIELGNWQTAADHVLALLENTTRQQTMARDGRQFVQRYSLRGIATAELEVMSSACMHRS